MNVPARCEKALATVLLGVFLALAFGAARHDSVTVDEFVNVPSGLARLRHFGETNWLNPFNPPLVAMLQAVPAALAGRTLPADWPAGEPVEYRWELGRHFQEANRAVYVETFLAARVVSLSFGLLCLIVVYRWSRELFGPGGALVSLALASLCPNLLTHAHLATNDMGFTALLLTSSWLLWRWVKSGWRPGPGAWFAVALSGALLAKFSTWFVLPLFAALAVLPLSAADAARPLRDRIRAIATTALVATLIGGALIGAFYAFDDVGKPLGAMEFRSRAFTALGAMAAPLPSPLPLWYLKGMDAEKHRVEARRNAFFYRGTVSRYPHPLYFVDAIVLKTPPAMLVLLAAAVVVALRSFRRDYLHLLLPPALILVVFSLVIGSNIGLRYVLPVYPYLMVLAGGLAVAARTGFARAALVTLVLGTATSTALAAPRFLSYFNVIAGGSVGGARLLSDSNIDWGQGLNDLRETMAREGIDEVCLSYFGVVDPALYGIAYRPLSELKPGCVVAISVHHLNGISLFSAQPAGLIERLRAQQPVARAGDSIVLYRF